MSLDKIFEHFQKLKDLITVHAPSALDRISEILGVAKDAVDDASAWLRGGKLLAKKVETAEAKKVGKKEKKALEEKVEKKIEDTENAVVRFSQLRDQFRVMGAKATATIMAERRKAQTALPPALEISLAKTAAGILDQIIHEVKSVTTREEDQENIPS